MKTLLLALLLAPALASAGAPLLNMNGDSTSEEIVVTAPRPTSNSDFGGGSGSVLTSDGKIVRPYDFVGPLGPNEVYGPLAPSKEEEAFNLASVTGPSMGDNGSVITADKSGERTTGPDGRTTPVDRRSGPAPTVPTTPVVSSPGQNPSLAAGAFAAGANIARALGRTVGEGLSGLSMDGGGTPGETGVEGGNTPQAIYAGEVGGGGNGGLLTLARDGETALGNAKSITGVLRQNDDESVVNGALSLQPTCSPGLHRNAQNVCVQ